MSEEAPEMASQEVKLSDAELGEKANTLIADFKDALMRSREFIYAVAETYLNFDPQSRNDLQRHPVDFFSRGFFYGVSYKSEPGTGRHWLRVTKHSSAAGWLEAIDLEVGNDEGSTDFTWGSIQYCKTLAENEDLEIESHTPTAVEKVEVFLQGFKGVF